MKNWWMFALAVLPAAGQVCSGNSDFQGPYVLVAARLLATVPIPGSPVPPGFAGSIPIRYSNTPIGQILRLSVTAQPFAIAARVIADGQGGVLAAAPDAQYVITRVGAYTVNGDCTVAMTLSDGFAAELDILGNTVTRANTNFQGVLQDRGSVAGFVQTSGGTDSVLQFERPQSGVSCTNATMSGAYGLLITGVDAGPADAPQALPFSLLGRFVAENGVFKTDTEGGASPQQQRQITGTYRVDPDCTGAAKLTLNGRTYNATFVLARGGVQFGAFQRSIAHFVIQEGQIVATGTAH